MCHGQIVRHRHRLEHIHSLRRTDGRWRPRWKPELRRKRVLGRGSTATSTNITAGGTSASTGSSPAIDVNTYCNGLLAGALVCDLEQFVNVSSCDFPLQRSPPDPALVEAAIDCLRIFQVKPDAGISGFHIDYSQNPAHLVLTDEYCDIMLRNGAQNVVVVQGCSCPC